MTMNDNSPMFLGNDYTPAPAPKKRAWWKKPTLLVGAGALVLGMMIGGAGKPEAPAPIEVEKVVEKEVKVPVEVKVPTAPAACIEYINLSEQAFTYSSEVMGYMSDALTAASEFDVAGMNAIAAKIEAVNPKIKALAPKVSAAKAECRAAE